MPPYIYVMTFVCTANTTLTTDPDAAARSAAGRALQRPKRRRRPPEDLRVVVPLDARTKAGRAARELRAGLLHHLGAKPSVPQLALVQQLVQLKLRLVAMDERFLAAGAKFSEHDSHMYLAWSNSFTRGLRELGLDSVAATDAPPSLADALAAGRAVAADNAPVPATRAHL